MSEYDNNHYINPNTLSDVRWVTVGVRPGYLHQTNLQRLPLAIADLSLLTIFVGDVIAVAPEMRSQEYVVARVGVHIGWINTLNVKLIPMRLGNRQAMTETKPSLSTLERERINTVHDEVETKPSIPDRAHLQDIRNRKQIESTQPKINDHPSQKASEKLSHIKRLINYMKGAVHTSNR